MGIIATNEEIKPRFIEIYKPNSSGHFYALNKQPYTTGKLVKLLNEEDAIDLKAKSRTVNYYIAQVPGFKIFFIHAGFEQPPDHIVQDAEIKAHIDEMCSWYLHHKIPGNKRTIKKFKIK